MTGIVYECSDCDERTDQRRCEDCNLFTRRAGAGGHCPSCDELILVEELLDQDQPKRTAIHRRLDKLPARWPPDTYTIVRRVRVDAEDISADPRSPRRRTIDPGQLALALEGTARHAYAASFVFTNIPTHDHPEHGETVCEVEAWFRRRTDIEGRIRDAKLGAALRHLPSGHQAVNTVWMWAPLLAGNLSILLQALPGID